jgi:hypothetical protein
MDGVVTSNPTQTAGLPTIDTVCGGSFQRFGITTSEPSSTGRERSGPASTVDVMNRGIRACSLIGYE